MATMNVRGDGGTWKTGGERDAVRGLALPSDGGNTSSRAESLAKDEWMLLGIDFGTTRTVVASVDRGNYPVVSFQTESGDAQEWYPSLVAARGDVRLYGFDAAARQNEPDWLLLRSFKRDLAWLGPDAAIMLGEQRVTALELLTEFLTRLRHDLDERSNLRLKPRERIEAVVSVPANANSNQRFITLEAFRRAGFAVRGTINEPSAAGIEYAHHYLSTGAAAKREHVVVYDLGGGTFDASVIGIAERRHEVVSSDGIAQLGGDDFDRRLLDLALEQAGIVDALDEVALFRLLEECREKKEGLHPNTRKVVVDLGRVLDGAGETVVSTGEFYERCRPLVEQTIETLESAMERAPDGAELDWDKVAAVYMVGGSSDLPIVARMLREKYGRQVRKSPYPHAATAIGLAIAADSDAGYTLRERFTRHFGVWRERDAGSSVELDVLFEKETLLPADGAARLERKRLYRPAHNVGHFRFIESSRLSAEGEPHGDLTPWDDIYFPFDPALQAETQLESVAVERANFGEQVIEELYTCDANGIIEVEIINRTSGHRRTYRLRGGATTRRLAQGK